MPRRLPPTARAAFVQVHQREPLFVGSPWEVDYLESVLQVGGCELLHRSGPAALR